MALVTNQRFLELEGGWRGPGACLLTCVLSGWLLAFKTPGWGPCQHFAVCPCGQRADSLPLRSPLGAHFFLPTLSEYPHGLLYLHAVYR